MIELREVEDRDWEQIAELAGVAVAPLEGVGPQDLWVTNRQSFVGDGYRRVAISEGRVVGYAGAEKDPDVSAISFHLFLVLDWTEPYDVVPLLYEALCAYLGRVGADLAWFREYANDERFIEFLVGQGFEVGAPYRIAEEELVNLMRYRPVGTGS